MPWCAALTGIASRWIEAKIRSQLAVTVAGSPRMNKATPSELIGQLNAVESKYAPSTLYFAGNSGLLRRGPRVSIVGSRKASDEALARARTLARVVVSWDGITVSGLAEGIDTAAHRATIDASGATIAVLGTPLDRVHPVSNTALQDLIARDHLVVSQFPSGRPIRPMNFPLRNRTMALLSDATVIVESRDGGGALHQGWEAIRLGRPLFLMRAILDRADLSWPAKMISYGAVVLTEADQLLEVLPPPGESPRLSFAF